MTPIQLKAIKAGVPFNKSDLFKTDIQIEAFASGKLSPEQAITIKTWTQIYALQTTNATYDQVLGFKKDFQVYAYSQGFLYEDAIKLKEFQKKAFDAGATIDETKSFTSSVQVEAFKRGIPFKISLLFTDIIMAAFNAGVESPHVLEFTNINQVEAFKKNIPVETSLLFNDPAQIYALERNITCIDALEFKNFQQIDAYEKGLDLELATGLEDFQAAAFIELGSYGLATNFTNSYQVMAYKTTKVSLDESYLFTNYYQVKALEAGMPYKKALDFDDFLKVYAYEQGLSTNQARLIENETQLKKSIAAKSQVISSVHKDSFNFAENYLQTDELEVAGNDASSGDFNN